MLEKAMNAERLPHRGDLGTPVLDRFARALVAAFVPEVDRESQEPEFCGEREDLTVRLTTAREAARQS